MPVVSIDYTRMTEADGYDGTEAGKPLIVMVDRRSEYVSADMVPHNGNFPHAVKRLAQNLKTIGYNM